LGGLGKGGNGGDSQDGEGEGAHVRKSIAARVGASAENSRGIVRRIAVLQLKTRLKAFERGRYE
jgi:hypothetical protein